MLASDPILWISILRGAPPITPRARPITICWWPSVARLNCLSPTEISIRCCRTATGKAKNKSMLSVFAVPRQWPKSSLQQSVANAFNVDCQHLSLTLSETNWMRGSSQTRRLGNLRLLYTEQMFFASTDRSYRMRDSALLSDGLEVWPREPSFV